MLEADKAAFVATLQQQSLEIRQKELSFYLERYANLSSTASIIAGFAFTGLATTRIPASASGWLAGGYWVAGSLCMTFSTYVVIIAGFSSVYGERLALQVAHPVPELAAPPRLPLPLTPPPHRAVHAPSPCDVAGHGSWCRTARGQSIGKSAAKHFCCLPLFNPVPVNLSYHDNNDQAGHPTTKPCFNLLVAGGNRRDALRSSAPLHSRSVSVLGLT